MKKVEVIIGDGVEQISLDLNTNSISIALQYSIDDVRDIDKKNSNYSKTITLPGTKKNNKAFGSLFDVNSDFTQYDPNLKKSARIVVDSSPVLEGHIQLTKVNKLNNVDLQGNLISYEVVIFDDSVDFIQSIGDKLVEDLDFSEYNHTYNKTSIENAWYSHTYDDVYQYPLMDKIVRGYQTTDFKPAFYHKALLLKIAEQAGEYDDNGVLIPNTGYTLEGSFMTKESDNITDVDFGSYHKEIILWDGDTPTISDAQALQREYKAGVTGTTPISLGTYQHSSLNASFNNKIKNNLNFDTLTPDPPYFDNTGGYTFNNAGGSDLDFGQWECSDAGKYNFTVKGNFTMDYIKQGISATANVYSEPDGFSATVKGGVRFSLIDVDTGFQYGSNIGVLGNFEDIPSGTAGKNLTNDLEVEISSTSIPLNAKVKLVASLYSNRSFGFGVATPYGVFTAIMNIELKFNPNGSAEFFNKTVKVENISDGDEIEISQYLPKEIKQKDIISDIIKRYNVYIRKHPSKHKTLLLETRDDFYDSNTSVIDWTQKKDYSNNDKISFISDLQNKEILFTYKKADDIKAADEGTYNKDYTISTGDIYGQKLISFNNDFVKGTKKIESIFSTTPLVYRGEDEINARNYVVVPSVKSTEEKRKPVLCYWGGMKPVKKPDGSSAVLFIAWPGTGGGIPYSTYPYAGHWNDPYTPTIDIHYGEVTYEFYSLIQQTTNNNLFNRCWRNYYNQISKGKLITSKFYLKETDINFIKDNLNTRIFIKDSYYVINKIIDYKPLEDGLTTVELLYIKQGTTFEIEEPASSQTFVTTGNYTFISSDDLQVNNVRSRNVRTLGRRNRVGTSSSASITGDDNTIYDNSTNISITGNGNEVESGVENVIIVGDNQTITDSNTSYINGTTFTLASPLSGLWERGTGSESLVQVNSAAPNTASNIYSITTGVQNTNDGMFSGILSGAANTINPLSDASVLAGGQTNTITGVNNFIGGGFNNNIGAPTTTRENSAIIAGSNNNVNVDYSVIVGGQTNTITGNESIILGGSSNINGSSRSAILGGYDNDLSNGVNSTILGGESNSIVGDRNAIIGGTNNTLDTSLTSIGSSVIVGGSVNVVGSTSERSSIIGGTINNITGSLSSIISGSNNTLSGDSSIIVGGSNNIIEHIQSVIISNGSSLTGAGSMNNYIFGGLNHIISAPAMFNNIVGGNNNEISGPTLFGGIISSTVSKIINASSSSNIIGAGSSEIDTGTYVNIFGGQNITISKNSFSYTLGGQLNGLSSGGAPSETHSGIIGGVSNTIDSSYSLILHSNLSSISKTTVGSTGVYNIILGGQDHIINVDTNNNNAILGGNNNTISSTTNRSLILGGQNITATQDDTAYLPKLVVTETYIPTGTTDVNGVVGEISYDGSYVYVKTTSGWLRSTLSTF